MYDQLREETLYSMLYAVVTTIAMLASCYLLFRRANAIAPNVTPPVRLRRWTAAFFAVFVVNHLWYLGPTFFLTSDDDVKLTNMIGILLDSMTFFPLSIIVLAVILLVFAIYVLAGGNLIYECILQMIVIVLICYLLWRVETLSDLSNPQPQSLPADETTTEEMEDNSLSPTIRDNIEALLQQHCIDTQLYLQHDLTVSQLAQAIGINRLYLSQYFSRQGISYNAYINDLRINHFVSLYREAVAAQRHFTAQQLAHDSGYQSYSTFSLAFKQRMGQSVTVWMRSAD